MKFEDYDRALLIIGWTLCAICFVPAAIVAFVLVLLVYLAW